MKNLTICTIPNKKHHLPGEHNRKNATVIEALKNTEWREELEIFKQINSFPGSGRRFE